MSYFHVSYLAVLIATVIQWLLGALWFGYVFKARWMSLVGIPEGEKPNNTWFVMVTSFVANLILSFVLANIISWAHGRLFPDGVWLGALCWLGFMAPPLFVQHIAEKRPAKLFAINGAYWLLAMMIAGGVLANLNVR
ncbi:MAG TPA: DUF1761 domain-containing protein [Terracidiphilus sp.]|jgi:hypothetical protein|nr:DUF1761 domain-containing protein [Terracidiphilus sp.]